MSLSAVAMLGRSLLMLASFAGLCAGLRTVFKLNRFITPYVAASGIIAVLMLGGMLRILEAAFWGIYILGFAGFIYAYLIRHEKPQYGMIAALAIFISLLVARFYFCPLGENDDISHWGLVARHLLRYDAFPDKNAPYVFFQSYPLGTASFMYYIGKTIANTEGIYLVAQELLTGLMLTPLISLFQRNRKVFYPVFVFFYLLVFSFFRTMISLKVDLLLGCFGIGMAASIAFYRSDLKKALIAALPGLIAVAYIKNSGLFFALMTALLLGYVAWRCTKKRSVCIRITLIPLALSIGAYLLWVLHIRLSYPAALDTKHAVSLAAYTASATSKGAGVILQIVRNYIRQVLKPAFPQACALAFVLGCIILLVYGMRKLPCVEFSAAKLRRALFVCLGVYLVWVFMVLLMYIFSMPENEALHVASCYRYNGTGLTYLMGLVAILFFCFFDREDAQNLLPLSLTRTGALVFIAAFVVLSFMNTQDIPFAKRIFKRETGLSVTRQKLTSAHEKYDLPDGGTYLAFCDDDGANDEPWNKYYQIKYEFETADIYMVAEDKSQQFQVGTWKGKEICTDAVPFMRQYIDQCDAMLIMDESDLFEAQLDKFLASYTGDTPIIYTYEY